MKKKEQEKQKDETSSGSGTRKAYSVEARVAHINELSPVSLNDGILTTEWREVCFDSGDNPAGVPYDKEWIGGLQLFRATSRMTIESATALAWTIIAQRPHKSIECRIVRHRQEYSHTDYREGVLNAPPIKEIWPLSIDTVDDEQTQEKR